MNLLRFTILFIKMNILCLKMMISFENLKMTQIYCLVNKKFSKLNLDQIPILFLKYLKLEFENDYPNLVILKFLIYNFIN